MDHLESRGFSSYIVGGSVRDSIMGETPSDWDICTSARPEQVEDALMDCQAVNKIIETGIKHGTVTAVSGTSTFEITTFRVDGSYSDGRHPDSVEFRTDVRDDLSRRDFTINAMAYSEKEGLIDPFGGRDDIEKKVIRCVGEPEKRFEEDALRIMRALRFASKLG
ncbi:MAG: CCA tRNA nucleotidyltransferase, partial [Anaerovoracaceae bacterium]